MKKIRTKTIKAAGSPKKKTVAAATKKKVKTTAKKAVSKAEERQKKKTVKPKTQASPRKAVKKTVKTKAKTTGTRAKAPAKKGAEKKTAGKKVVTKEQKKIALPKKRAARIPQSSFVRLVGEKSIETGPAFFEKAYERISAKKLPKGYGENRITLMVVDPWKLFAYWEAREETLSKAKGVMVLRVYDVTGIKFDGKNANIVFDIAVFDRIGDSYIGVGPGRDFIVDIGTVSGTGEFTSIARSNKAATPSIKISKEEGVLPQEMYEAGPVVGYF